MGKIGIISDTHENVRLIIKAVELFKARGLDLVVHCGDIISPPVLERFAGLPIRFVFGNNDGERSGLKKKCLELGFGEIDDTLEFTNSGKSFLVYHGTRASKIEEIVQSQQYDFVLHGHTHEVRDEIVGRTRILNPGALFAVDEPTVGILDVNTGEFEIIEIKF